MGTSGGQSAPPQSQANPGAGNCRDATRRSLSSVGAGNAESLRETTHHHQHLQPPIRGTNILTSTCPLTHVFCPTGPQIILGMMVHSYANGGNVPWHQLENEESHQRRRRSRLSPMQDPTSGTPVQSVEIPEQLAVPFAKVAASNDAKQTLPESCFAIHVLTVASLVFCFRQVCEALGLPTVLTAALDLWNWKKARGGWQPRSLSALSLMTGSDTERFFHMIPCAIQVRDTPHHSPVVQLSPPSSIISPVGRCFVR